MKNGGVPDILCYLRRAVARAGGDPTWRDAELLGRFVDSRDRFAFEALVRRHAGLVWNVCRRILHDEANAEDAFQAVFLTLVRKAHTIDRRGSVASWLHKVAYRVALEARRQAARRSAREVPVMEHHLTRSEDDVTWRELRPILDEEVCRLPEKYRAPVILCYLQGRSNAQAAHELGCPTGTVVTRLAWARRRLRTRLTQRGVTASAGLLTAVLVEGATASGAPPSVIDVTIRASLLLAAGDTAGVAAHAATALSLSQAATSAVTVARVKFAAVAAVCLTLVGGGAAVLGRGNAGESPLHAMTAPALANAGAFNPEPIAYEPEPAADEDPPPRLLAFFERADQDKITVTFRGKSGAVLERITLSVAADATITQNSKSLRLVDLKPGWLLKIMLSADESKVVTIRVKEGESSDANRALRAPELRGTLKSLDRDGRITVTVRTEGKDQDRTLPLASRVKTQLDDAPAAIADLKPGMAVWLKLAPDGESVAKIMAEKATP